MTNKRPDFLPSIDNQMIGELFHAAEVGETVTYAAMSEAVGYTVDGGSGVVQSARRRIERDYDMVFAAVRSEGFRRLSSAEIVQESERGVMKLRRGAKRAARKLGRVEYEELSPDEQVQHNARLSLLGAMAALGQKSAEKKVVTAVEKAGATLPLGKTLALFGIKKDAAE